MVKLREQILQNIEVMSKFIATIKSESENRTFLRYNASTKHGVLYFIF